MIPKIIHYCWFVKGKKSEEILQYINGWKNILKGYEFIEWNEENFNIYENQYVAEAYEEKKWAFVTDYVRLHALYNYGGIYMDTDVEVLKSLDVFLKHKAFSGFESDNSILTGIIGAEKNNIWIKKLLDDYKDRSFYKEDGSLDLTTNVITITRISKKLGVKLDGKYQEFSEGVVVYPSEIFSPKSHLSGEINMTNNTYCIHHFNGSWIKNDRKKNIRPLVIKMIGEENYIRLSRLKDKYKRKRSLK